MLRPDLMEAYARRLIAALRAELGTQVTAIHQRTIERPGEEGGEWIATLENGSRIRLQAVILTPSKEHGPPPEPSREELEDLRELGISPEDVEPL